MASIVFTDTGGTWRLHNGKVFPASRFGSWTPESAPHGDSAAAAANGALTMLRLRDDFGVSFEVALLPSLRSNQLLLRAEELDHAAWTKIASTVTANASRDPYGSTTAEKVDETVAVNSHGVMQPAPVFLSSGANYLLAASYKPAERTWAFLVIVDKAGVSHGQFFNLATGAKGGAYGGAQVASDIFYEGNSWYRCWLAVNVGIGGATPEFYLYMSTGDGVVTYAGSAANGLYMAHAQVDVYRSGRPPAPFITSLGAIVEDVTQAEIADRLKYHLMNGGTCAVYPNDIGAAAYATCGLKPGTTPSLQLTDRRTLEYTLSLQLINLAAPPTRMVARYIEQ